MNIYLIECFPLPTMSFGFFSALIELCSFIPLFFSYKKCALLGLGDSLMAPISFHANWCILEASKERMVLFVSKTTEIQNRLPKTCLQVKWTSCLFLQFLTWLHTGFINLLWVLSSSAVKSQLFHKWAVADPAKLLLDMSVCKSLSTTLDLKTGKMRALIIFPNLNTICLLPVWRIHFSYWNCFFFFFFKYKEHLCLSWDTFFSLHWAFLKPAPLCELCGEPFGEQLCAI